jgi:hypothetical protein
MAFLLDAATRLFYDPDTGFSIKWVGTSTTPHRRFDVSDGSSTIQIGAFPLFFSNPKAIPGDGPTKSILVWRVYLGRQGFNGPSSGHTRNIVRHILEQYRGISGKPDRQITRVDFAPLDGEHTVSHPPGDQQNY